MDNKSSALKNLGWSLALGLGLGGFAGLCDAGIALVQNPALARGKDGILYLSDVLCWYGLGWALVLFIWGLLLLAGSRILKNKGHAASDFSAHIVSAGLTLQIYISTAVWLNDRFLPNSTNIKSIAGNVVYLLFMAVIYCLLLSASKIALSHFRNRFAARLGATAVWAPALLLLLNIFWVLPGSPGSRGEVRQLSGKSRGDDINVILITIDALRPDHLSCYGYRRSRTPNIDLLAEQGARFENALSNAPQTFNSFSSMFTSNYPDALGFCQLEPFPEAFPTLAQTLSGAGINTAAILSNPYLAPALQVTRGFEYFYHAYEPGFVKNIKGTHLNLFLGRILNRMAADEKAENQVRRAMNWLDQNQSRPFFLWLYLIEAHFPYGDSYIKDSPTDPGYMGKLGDHINDSDLAVALSRGQTDLSAEDLRHIEYLYDRDIRYVDAQLGKFFQYLREMGLWEKTAIILTADHGEAFGERKMVGHCNHLYWEYVHIPLLIKLPGTSPRTVSAPVELLDLSPTVLDIFKVDAPETFLGKSLVGLMHGETGRHKPYLYSVCNRYSSPEIFLRDPRYTLVYRPREKTHQLFDRSVDPLETQDLSRAQPETARVLLDELIKTKRANRELYLKHHPQGKPTGKVNLDQRVLRSLGYAK